MKLFEEIRKMEQEGTLKFDKFAPDMTIPDNFEDSLGKGGGGSMAMHSSSGPALAAVSSAPPPAGTPSDVAEELSALRRKVVQMNGELQKLMHDNHSMKEKLDQIRKIA
jgi:hypothetical protein